MKHVLLPLLGLLALPALAPAAVDRVAEASSGKAPEAGDRVLFPLDEVSIPWRDNLKLTLERPAKFPGNPIMGPGPIAGPDGYGVVLYGTVLKQDGKFRMWYLASPRVDAKIRGDDEDLEYYRPVAYAESTDGVHWTRPDLGLVEFRGNKHNNLVRIEPSNEPYGRAFDFVAVYFDPTDPDASQRYKMAYITHDIARASGSTATAVSPDGLNWQLANTTMFTGGHFENTSLIRFDGLYYLGGQNIPPHDAELADGSPAGRVMKVFFSPDFRHWSAGRALAFYRYDYTPKPVKRGEENHMGAGLWNRGNVILGYYGRWHGEALPAKNSDEAPLAGLKVELGLVVSNDAVHYREPERNFVVVPNGPDTAWDSEAVLQANAFANTETETYIWYSHWDTSRNSDLPTLTDVLPAPRQQKACAVGLLTMPRDRFGYFSKLSAGTAGLLTASLTFAQPESLSANVTGVSPDAPLTVSLVTDAEETLPGYTAELTADSLKAPIVWAGGHKALPVGKHFRIKLTWPEKAEHARLYALYLEHQ